MKPDPLKQFATLKVSLTEEKARCEARLAELNVALGTADAHPAPTASVSAPVVAGKKRGMSAAGRARIIAAQKARWAKYNAEQGTTKAAPKKARKKMSAAGRARIAAAAKARWAKFHAAKGK